MYNRCVYNIKNYYRMLNNLNNNLKIKCLPGRINSFFFKNYI